MCLGVPGRLVAVSADGAIATLDLAGDAREVSLALLADDPPRIGDWVSVHMGFAMSRLTEDEAREALDAAVLLASADDGPGESASSTDRALEQPGFTA